MAYTSVDKVLMRMTSFLVRKPVHDDDVVDRLHHNASLVLLLVFAAGTALQEYVGEPINCWTPKAYPQEHYTDHVNGFCWTHPLRYPQSSYEELLDQRRVVNFGTAFYRWVTLIFVLQAVLFKLPNVVWNYLNRQSGASLSKLKDLLTEAQLNKDERQLRMDEAAQYLHSWIAAYRVPTPRRMFGREIATGKLACLLQGCGRRSGKYLCVVYLCVKALYLLNVVGNFVLLTVFLDAEFWRYGVTVLNEVFVKGDWSDPVNFPRMLICDFRLHDGGEMETATNGQEDDDVTVHTVQCVLSINMVLEKLFVLQWFWLVGLAFLTLLTLISWSVYTVCACAPYFFARKYMKSLMYRGKDDPDDSRSGERFVQSYLREDGIFILRMVEANSDHMVVKELVQHLWDNFQARDAATTKELTEEIEMMMKEDNEEEETSSGADLKSVEDKEEGDKEESCQV